MKHVKTCITLLLLASGVLCIGCAGETTLVIKLQDLRSDFFALEKSMKKHAAEDQVS